MSPEQRDKMIQHFEQECRRYGLALTVQRRVIYESILGRHDHPTADDVYEVVKVRLPTISRTTVYRVLDSLNRAGVIAKINHPGTGVRYEPSLEHHHHLICRECEKLIDIHDDALSAIPLPNVKRLGFEINDFCIHFRGICLECRARVNGRAAQPRAVTAKNRPRPSKRVARRKRTSRPV